MVWDVARIKAASVRLRIGGEGRGITGGASRATGENLGNGNKDSFFPNKDSLFLLFVKILTED